ncbi:hypothetical protein DPMN_094941 [Dreissena polymorpha]|uniref:Uncharacterized protein n=1 Tax=Dreissena polymorpha TaxID=45954 RepID=A0A9D4L8B7_DREPO|nr:hypothetical protein DPMN_094941 [Dreissena polymorpha]
MVWQLLKVLSPKSPGPCSASSFLFRSEIEEVGVMSGTGAVKHKYSWCCRNGHRHFWLVHFMLLWIVISRGSEVLWSTGLFSDLNAGRGANWRTEFLFKQGLLPALNLKSDKYS